jgi:hypothetical protein
MTADLLVSGASRLAGLDAVEAVPAIGEPALDGGKLAA